MITSKMVQVPMIIALVLPLFAASLEVLVTSVCVDEQLIPLVGSIGELLNRNHIVTLLLYGNCSLVANAQLGSSVENLTVIESDVNFDFYPIADSTSSDKIQTAFSVYSDAFLKTYQVASDFFDGRPETRFDVVLCDSFSLGTLVLAELKRIPVVINTLLLPRIHSSYYNYKSWHSIDMWTHLSFIRSLQALVKNGVDKVLDMRTNLVLEGKYLTAYEYFLGFTVVSQGSFSLEPSNTRYKNIGFSSSHIRVQHSVVRKWIDGYSKPIVLLSLGVFSDFDFTSLQAMFASYAKYRFIYLITDKFRTPPDNPVVSSSDNVMVIKGIPHGSLLKENKVHMFVSDCEPYKVMESMASKVPLICRPCVLEQFYASDLVVKNKVGVVLPSENSFDEKTLKDTIDGMFSRRTTMLDSLTKVNENWKENGNEVDIVTFIEQVATKRVLYHPYTRQAWPWSYALVYTSPATVVFLLSILCLLSTSVLLYLTYHLCCNSSQKSTKKKL